MACAFLNNGRYVLLVTQLDRFLGTYCRCVDMGKLFLAGLMVTYVLVLRLESSCLSVTRECAYLPCFCPYYVLF